MQLRRKHERDYATAEHLIPRSLREKDVGVTVLLACARCNKFKGAAPVEPALVARARRLYVEWLTHSGQHKQVAEFLDAKDRRGL